MTAGTSTTATRGDGAHEEAQAARRSDGPALPGSVTDAPSAAPAGADGQDGAKTPLTEHRTITKVVRDATTLRVTVTLNCGHTADPNAIYSYKVGAPYRCFNCGEAERKARRAAEDAAFYATSNETCDGCGGSRLNVRGCAGCCRDCGFPCDIEKDNEAFHADPHERDEDCDVDPEARQ